MQLTDKVALVTGAASGLGLATSQALLAAGIEEGDPVYIEKAQLIWSEQE